MRVGFRVRRSKRGLSQKVSLGLSPGVCGGQGSQIQKGAVTQGVAGGVVWCVWGSGFADPKGGCHTRCGWRCRLVCVGVRVRRSKRGLSHKVSLEVSSGVCGQGSQVQEGQDGAVTERCRLVRVGFRVRRSKRGLS